MITLLTGAPGHGKSYTLVRMIERSVVNGEGVGTNVPLRPDWAEVMAKRHTLFPWFRRAAVARKAEQFRRQVFISEDFQALLRIRLAGKGEGRGKLILDELNRKLNARGWDSEVVDGVPVKRTVAIANRQKVLDHLSGHRHYGFDVVLSTQDMKNIDSQIRDLYEFHSEVRNMKRLPWFGLLFRFNFFVCKTFWNDRARTRAGVSCYWLSKSLARLYHTHALEAIDWPDDAILLPMTPPLDSDDPPTPLHGQLCLDVVE